MKGFICGVVFVAVIMGIGFVMLGTSHQSQDQQQTQTQQQTQAQHVDTPVRTTVTVTVTQGVDLPEIALLVLSFTALLYTIARYIAPTVQDVLHRNRRL